MVKLFRIRCNMQSSTGEDRRPIARLPVLVERELLYWPYVALLTDGSHSPRTSGVPPVATHHPRFAWTRRKHPELGTRHHASFKTGMSESFLWPNKPLRLLLSVAPFPGLGDLIVVGDTKETIDRCLVTLLDDASEGVSLLSVFDDSEATGRQDTGTGNNASLTVLESIAKACGTQILDSKISRKVAGGNLFTRVGHRALETTREWDEQPSERIGLVARASWNNELTPARTGMYSQQSVWRQAHRRAVGLTESEGTAVQKCVKRIPVDAIYTITRLLREHGYKAGG
ncbi:hypothetical protein BKA93DRAFT_746764 [Sparassis latifolia]